MTKIIAVDPGVSTGIAMGQLGSNTPLRITGQYQVGGGLTGFLSFFEDNRREFRSSAVVAEKFTPRSGGGFSHTLKSVEPLRIEGALIALNLLPDYDKASAHWQQPTAQYFAGGADLKERKARSREFLRRSNAYATGKVVGQKDADDAISATLHLFAYARGQHHIPTLTKYFRNLEK